VSGDVSMVGSRIARGRFETVSGDLQLSLDLAERGRLNAESMSGDVNYGFLPPTSWVHRAKPRGAIGRIWRVSGNSHDRANLVIPARRKWGNHRLSFSGNVVITAHWVSALTTRASAPRARN
jgi:hypothetical protein